MQIHELTRKQLNEVDLAGPGGLLAGIKSAGKALMQPGGVKDALRAVTPGANQGAVGTAALATSDFAKRMQAQSTNKAFDQVAKNLQGNWEQRRAAQVGVATKSGQPMTQQTINALIDDWYATTVIPANLRSEKTSYMNPSGGPAPAKIVSTLQNIKNAETLPDAQRQQTQATEIKNLAVATSAMSQLLAQQNPQLAAAASRAAPKTGSAQAAQANISKAAGINPTQLAAIEKITGALPPVASRDPNTIAYLRALGFDVQ
jgi:hypothetical protein